MEQRRPREVGPEPRVVPDAGPLGRGAEHTDEGQKDHTTRHAVGMTAGGSAGALAGGALGAVAGPGGMIVGAAIGAVAGLFAGRGITEAMISADEEEAFWRDTHRTRPYIRQGSSYDEYRHAYRYGWENAAAHVPEGRTFEGLEPELERHWPRMSGQVGAGEMNWMHARPAAHDAWQRVESRIKRREHDAGRTE